MTTQLIVMRLIDMARVHPGQDNSRRCSQCDHRVGIYPSGQYALRRYPELEIVCARCSDLDRRPMIAATAARSVDEFIAEHRNSEPVKKA